MDEMVLKALQKWSNVPSLRSWLSLNERGEWRLHPEGSYHIDASGEAIENKKMIDFINRNYACDELGEWYFQNGPQKVYVNLAAHVPWVLHCDAEGQLYHQGQQSVDPISAWYIDSEGRLYAEFELGIGLILSSAVSHVLERLEAVDHKVWDEALLTQILYDERCIEVMYNGNRHVAPLRKRNFS